MIIFAKSKQVLHMDTVTTAHFTSSGKSLTNLLVNLINSKEYSLARTILEDGGCNNRDIQQFFKEEMVLVGDRDEDIVMHHLSSRVDRDTNRILAKNIIEGLKYLHEYQHRGEIVGKKFGF